jgi:hypothetical protein
MDALNLGEGTLIWNCAKQGGYTVYKILAVKDNFHIGYSLKFVPVWNFSTINFVFVLHARKRAKEDKKIS